MHQEPDRVLFYPVDAEFSAQWLTLPVVLFALPIVAVTAIVYLMWQSLRVTYALGLLTQALAIRAIKHYQTHRISHQ